MYFLIVFITNAFPHSYKTSFILKLRIILQNIHFLPKIYYFILNGKTFRVRIKTEVCNCQKVHFMTVAYLCRLHFDGIPQKG